MLKVINITGHVEVPFECNIQVTEEQLDKLLSGSSFLTPYSKDKETFMLLYDKLIIDADDIENIDIDFIIH